MVLSPWLYNVYTMPDNSSCRHERMEGFSYDLDMKTRKQNRKKTNERKKSDLNGLSNGYKRAWLLVG